MKPFMDADYLLQTETAKKLYHEHAENMPVIDYHCHINPQEIAEDRRYDNITQVWLGGDHYKWRAMRCAGIPESDITGSKDTDPYRTFAAWAKALPKAIGNPLYSWTYLELKKYFGITESLTPASAQRIYDQCNARLQEPDMTVRGIIKQSNVRLVCTTDDPVDDLRWHKAIREDPTCEVKVLPAWRPDKAMNVEKVGFVEYIAKLSAVSGVAIKTYADLCAALDKRFDFFHSMGCRVSDHGLDYCVYTVAPEAELDAILAKGLAGEGASLTPDQYDAFKTALLLHMAEKYAANGWVMQLHYGCLRNNSTRMFDALGPDTGFDAVATETGTNNLGKLLNAMQMAGNLPRTIIYSLNQRDNEAIATLCGCFQTDGGIAGKIQMGSAWWFNDNKTGMEKQITDLANLGVLGSFIGMLTDSRSYLSYTRHDLFRRILCNWIGNQVENGEYQNDLETLGQIVEDICYNNTVNYFGFDQFLD